MGLAHSAFPSLDRLRRNGLQGYRSSSSMSLRAGLSNHERELTHYLMVGSGMLKKTTDEIA